MELFPRELFKWMMNDGKRLEKIYKCWPLPEAFSFAIGGYFYGHIDRRQTKILLDYMFKCASMDEKLKYK